MRSARRSRISMRTARFPRNRKKIAVPGLVEPVVLQGPEQRDEFRRSRLQECRHEDVIGAETNAVAADGGARLLIQRFDIFRHVATEKHPETFDEMEGKPLGETFEVFGARQIV